VWELSFVLSDTTIFLFTINWDIYNERRTMKLIKLVPHPPSKKRKYMIVTQSQMKRLADSYVKQLQDSQQIK
jgi:hypothetical protein